MSEITKKLTFNHQQLSTLFLLIVSLQYSLINTELQLSGLLNTSIVVLEVILFIGYLFRTKFTEKKLFLIFIFLFISVVTYFTTGLTTFLVIFMVAIICEKKEYSSIFKILIKTRLIMLFVVIFLSFIGIIGINETNVIKSGHLTSMCYGLGFTHPNRLAFCFELIAMLVICYRNKSLKFLDYIIVIIFVLVGYCVTKSRTLILCITVMLSLICLCKIKLFNEKLKKILYIVSLYIIPFCAIVSTLLPLLMTKATGHLQTILYTINGLFSSRFTHIYRAFFHYPINVFGGIEDFPLLEEIYNFSTVDNGYIRLLYSFGIFGFVIYIIFSQLAIKRLIKKNQYIYIIVIIVISLWGITENILLSFAYNISIVFWCELLKNDDNDREYYISQVIKKLYKKYFL